MHRIINPTVVQLYGIYHWPTRERESEREPILSLLVKEAGREEKLWMKVYCRFVADIVIFQERNWSKRVIFIIHALKGDKLEKVVVYYKKIKNVVLESSGAPSFQFDIVQLAMRPTLSSLKIKIVMSHELYT